MSDSEVKSKNRIPQRDDIEEKYKWDLLSIFINDDAWEKALEKARLMIKGADKYIGKLADDPAVLFECLEKRSELGMLLHNIFQYAKLNQDLDNRKSTYQAMVDRAATLAAQAEAAFSFVEPELSQLDDGRLRELAGQFPQTDVYDFYIEDLIRSRKHIRSAEVEEILAQSSVIARGPSAIFTMLDNADVRFPSIKDETGEDVPLTKERFARFMESSDQRIRRDAHNGINEYYKNMINTIGASYSAEVNKNIFYAHARKHESALHASLYSDNIPVEVYRSLIDTTNANIEGMHKWMAVRKKILKLDRQYPYDVYCPLFPDYNYNVPYEDAVVKVIEAMQPLGDEYERTLKTAFAERWVDVYETEGKQGGAYNWGNYEVHPFIKMNYNDTINNMFTLAHEMGHAMHSWFSAKKQPFPKSAYTLFVAEVASTLNEGLLQDYLLKRTDDKMMRMFLLNKHIGETMTTYFFQVFFADFELQAHEIVEKGGALSPDICNELFENLTRKYYGEAVEIDELTRYKWSRIPHFYRCFYVYQYATAYAASQDILTRFQAGEKGLIDKYLEFLSSGGNDYPIDQLKKCGVDMTTPAPFEATLKLFAQQVDEIEKLI